MAKGEIFVFTALVLMLALGMLVYKLWQYFSKMAWERARRTAPWFSRSSINPDGSVTVLVRREAWVGWSVEMVGEPVEVATIKVADLDLGLLQEAEGRAEIVANTYNRTSLP
jgi:hypothetical protein